MKEPLNIGEFELKRRTSLRSHFVEGLVFDDESAQEVAGPLFDAGIRFIGLYERQNYNSNSVFRPSHNLALVLQGNMYIKHDSDEHILNPGDLMIAPSGTTMQRSVGPSPAWYLLIEIEDQELWEGFKRGGFRIIEYEASVHLFLLVRNLLDAKLSHSPSAATHSFNDCRSILNLLRCEASNINPQSPLQANKLYSVVEKISADPGGDWSRESIAAKLNLSVRQTTRLFRQELGMSPHQLVFRERMRIATQELANSNRPVQAIASDLGYDSMHSFTRLFTKHIGMSPGQYRKRLDA